MPSLLNGTALFGSLLATVLISLAAQAEALKVRQITSSRDNTHTCAILSNNRLKCVGLNTSGMLGLGLDVRSRPENLGDALPALDLGTDLPLIKLALGPNINCAMFEDPIAKKRQAKCWGNNSNGALGVVLDNINNNIGDEPKDMGENLPFIPLPPHEDLTDIAAAEGYICILTNRRFLRCSQQQEEEFIPIHKKKPTILSENEDVTELSLWLYHGCLLFTNQRMKCWGSSPATGSKENVVQARELSKMPFIETAGPVKKMALSLNHTCALLEDSSVQCWGHNDREQLGIGSSKREVKFPEGKVDLGAFGEVVDIASNFKAGTCALSRQGLIKCWGQETPYGDMLVRGPRATMGDNLPAINFGLPVQKLSQNCVILSNGGAKCWGSNIYGQLAIGDNDYRGDEPDEVGINLPYAYLWD